jgi:hypothetical protein
MEVLSIKKSPRALKKYRADIVLNGKLYRNVDFGDVRYEQYRDSTPLGLYSHLDHHDLKRKQNYLARHRKDSGPAGRLAREFLWS